LADNLLQVVLFFCAGISHRLQKTLAAERLVTIGFTQKHQFVGLGTYSIANSHFPQIIGYNQLHKFKIITVR
jgi:hypothetical protein